MVPQIQPQPPRFLIEAIRERHKTSAGQLVDPVFAVGRVTCTEVLVEDSEDTEDSEDAEDSEEWEGVAVKRRNYMYSYRMELIDSSGEKITAVLRPGLHESASEEAFTQGMRVKLTEWKVRETVTRGGMEVMFLDLEEFEVVGQEEDDEYEAVVEKVGSSADISASFLSSWSTTSTAREVEEQLRNEFSRWGQKQGEEITKPSPTPVHNEQLENGAPKPRESPDGEENYDDGTDYLLLIGSFSTPHLLGAQVSLAPETPLPQTTQKSDLDTPSQTEMLSDGKSIALSTLGKRFLDDPKMSQESVSPFSSSSPAKRPRITSDNSNEFAAPTEPAERTGPPSAQHPSLIAAAVSWPNMPPSVSPHTPASAFSSAAAVHAARVKPPTKPPTKPPNIWSLLRPCRLADLPSRPHGSKVDILAIIHSIDTHLITRNKSVKRDCHLVDPSSPLLVPAPTQPHLKQPHHNELKPTILSVWVKPQSFIPRVGTLVAFRGLTVHRYAGRSLNAFSDVAGSVWYLENPGNEIDGAEEMGEWWADRCMREVAEELERKEERERREREREMDGEGAKEVGWK
ncbi:hypothetical protein EV426DRAFT_571793 [Tirmania nivea]|nr:hypothetical protein EV426DRAFT_571793 [Tirmania nivea]